MRRPRCLAALAGAALVVIATVVPAGVSAAQVAPPPQLSSPKADILVDAGTGKVLVGDHVHDSLHPASTAKLLTALTAVERLAPDAVVSADPNTAAIPTNKIGFPATARWPLDQMLAALLMESANDAAYAIAKTAGGGSLDTFAAQMTETAKRLGLRESKLNDPSGLDNASSFKGGPYMSAYDLAIATRNALTVPAIAKWAALRQYSFVDPQGGQHPLTNHNKMLPGAAYAYAGMTGFKTGYTDRAQHTLVATATRNGRTLIVVILGAPTSGYAEAASLLDAGFAMPPNAAGTGETLPEPAVSLYAKRASDLAGFQALGSGDASPSKAVVSNSPTVPKVIPVFDSPPREAAVTRTATGSTTAPDHGGAGLLQARNIVLALIVMGLLTFALRRRSVRRQRLQRLARQRQRAAAMRSGGLPVVDGRYRPGMRLGPPLESHVRVRPVDEPRAARRGVAG